MRFPKKTNPSRPNDQYRNVIHYRVYAMAINRRIIFADANSVLCGGLAFFLFLQGMQEIHGAMRMSGGGEYGTLVVLQHFQP